ncbi:hypothetical protein NQ317_013614, partial [Molorchus minor]
MYSISFRKILVEIESSGTFFIALQCIPNSTFASDRDGRWHEAERLTVWNFFFGHKIGIGAQNLEFALLVSGWAWLWADRHGSGKTQLATALFGTPSRKPGTTKKKSSGTLSNSIDLKQGEILTDIYGKKWKLGKSVGIGGFGEIYQASDNLSREVKTDTNFVAKVERHSNGPLFVEINCYLRIAKSQLIDEWKIKNNLNFLGMPHYVASGSHMHNGEKYRFLILPKFEKDLEKIFQEKKYFNLKTVLTISIQIVDVLEYIHNCGYVHSDIKASNMMLGTRAKVNVVPVRRTVRVISTRSIKKRPRTAYSRNLRPVGAITYVDDIPYLDEVLNMYEKHDNFEFSLPKEKQEKLNTDQIYLLDYGLASKYLLTNGQHKEYSTDQRRAHAGTVLFCSRDAHKGVPSRRSDLESLAYNMVYWLTGSLPWMDDVEEPEMVEKKKIRDNGCIQRAQLLAIVSVASIGNEKEIQRQSPTVELTECTQCKVNSKSTKENPDYDHIKTLFKKAIKNYGYKDDSRLDFDNLEILDSKQKKLKRKVSTSDIRKIFQGSFLKTSPLMPLHSNIIFKRPKLRKKIKDKKIKDSRMNWSKILTDPETIMKQATRERKTTEGSDPGGSSLASLDLDSMNPTYAMLEVYNKCKERETSPKYKGDSYVCNNIEGYTPAMMYVYTRMKERQALEFEEACSNYNNNKVNHKNKRSSTRKRTLRGAKKCESPQMQRLVSRSKSQL